MRIIPTFVKRDLAEKVTGNSLLWTWGAKIQIAVYEVLSARESEGERVRSEVVY